MGTKVQRLNFPITIPLMEKIRPNHRKMAGTNQTRMAYYKLLKS